MSELETKAGAGNVGAAFEDFMRAFEAFKETNDERLDALERRSAADPLIEEKLTRIDRALDEHRRTVDDLALKAARPPLGGTAPRTGVALAHKAAFDGYVRKGEPGRLRDLESKALSVGTGTDGGYLVPDEVERAVNRAVKDVSPIRAIAGIRQVSGSVCTGSRSRSPAPSPAGSPRPGRAMKPTARHWPRSPRCPSPPWSSTPCRRRPRACSTTAPSTSTSGSPRRCATASPSRRAPPSSPATAPPSRRASSTTPRSTTPLGRGATSAT
jgi:hypothetical protein